MFEDVLASQPCANWQTQQVIVVDWYDGPREGLCHLAQPASEFYFVVLAENAGVPKTREELQREMGMAGGDRSIDVQVTRLRRKFEPDPRVPRYLLTVRGQGYVLKPD